MNTLHLAYAVEVERCGSITQAAENLYMAQPNLSKAIKELEESMGFAIFARTSRGVTTTARGKEFLGYARAILTQVRRMESLSGEPEGAAQRFSLVLPHDGSAAACFERLMESLDPDRPMEVRVREGGLTTAVSEVADGRFQLGVVRVEAACEKAFLELAAEKTLSVQPLREYEAQLSFSALHPLADAASVARGDLSPYVEITCGDAPLPRGRGEEKEEPRRVTVCAYRQLLELLGRLPYAYAWSAPESSDLLARHGLVQRSCADHAPRFRDMLIMPAGYRLSALDQRFYAMLAE